MSLKPKQMHLMCGDLNTDHSKTNAKFSTLKNVLGGYDLSIVLTGFTNETNNSQTRIESLLLTGSASRRFKIYNN